MEAAAETEPMVKLISSDEVVFDVPVSIARMSLTVKNMLEDLDGQGGSVPLPNVTAKSLETVLNFCKHYVNVPEMTEAEQRDAKNAELTDWESQFCKSMTQADLFEIILAANYLDIKRLLDVTCKSVANMLKGKTPEEIRVQFNIKNDFTPEEEAQVRRENEWCEER